MKNQLIRRNGVVFELNKLWYRLPDLLFSVDYHGNFPLLLSWELLSILSADPIRARAIRVVLRNGKWKKTASNIPAKHLKKVFNDRFSESNLCKEILKLNTLRTDLSSPLRGDVDLRHSAYRIEGGVPTVLTEDDMELDKVTRYVFWGARLINGYELFIELLLKWDFSESEIETLNREIRSSSLPIFSTLLKRKEIVTAVTARRKQKVPSYGKLAAQAEIGPDSIIEYCLRVVKSRIDDTLDFEKLLSPDQSKNEEAREFVVSFMLCHEEPASKTNSFLSYFFTQNQIDIIRRIEQRKRKVDILSTLLSYHYDIKGFAGFVRETKFPIYRRNYEESVITNPERYDPRMKEYENLVLPGKGIYEVPIIGPGEVFLGVVMIIHNGRCGELEPLVRSQICSIVNNASLNLYLGKAINDLFRSSSRVITISFPKLVRRNQMRDLLVKVGLPRTFDTDFVIGDTGLPYQLFCTADGGDAFKIKPTFKEMSVPFFSDSDWYNFTVQPLKIGKHRIRVDFSRGGRLFAFKDFPVDVVEK